MAASTKLGCRFFRTEQGHEPVRKWLKSLPGEVTKEIGSDIERVQWQWPADDIALGRERQKVVGQ